MNEPTSRMSRADSADPHEPALVRLRIDIMVVEIARDIDGAEVQVRRDRREVDGDDRREEESDHPDGQRLEAEPEPRHFVILDLRQIGIEDEESENRRPPERVSRDDERLSRPDAPRGVLHGPRRLDALRFGEPVDRRRHAEAAEYADEEHRGEPRDGKIPRGEARERERVEHVALVHRLELRDDRVRSSRGVHSPDRHERDRDERDDPLLEVGHHDSPVAGREHVHGAERREDREPHPRRPAEEKSAYLAHRDADPAEDKHIEKHLPARDPPAQELGRHAAVAQRLPFGLAVGERAAEYLRRDERAYRAPCGEESVPEPREAVLVHDPRHPHRRVGRRVRRIDRRGGKPPREPAPREEEIGFRALPEAIEEGAAPDHEENEGHEPEPVEERKMNHGTILSLGDEAAGVRAAIPPVIR